MRIDEKTYKAMPAHLQALFRAEPNPARDEVLALFPNQKSPAPYVQKSASVGMFGPEAHHDRLSTHHGDSGSAARFFQQCKVGYNEAWQDLNLPPEDASTAEQSSSQQRQAAASALVLAVNSALPEELRCTGLLVAPSTSATGSELSLIADSVTQTIQSIDSRFWLGSRPARLSLSLNHASVAASLEQTGTMTITVSLWKSDGSADPVTFSITPRSLEAGAKDCEQSTENRRFIYCAKASKADRDEGLDEIEAKACGLRDAGRFNSGGRTLVDGEWVETGSEPRPKRNTHPTVKPTALMRYLCRLVTPPGGTVLDPFTGSGSTGKAAILEGFAFIGIELDDAYIKIAHARIDDALREAHAARDHSRRSTADLFAAEVS